MGGGTRVGNGTTRHDTEGQGGCALARRRGTAAMGAVKGTRGVGILSVRRRQGGELDKQWLVVATRRAWACQRTVLTRRGAREL
jgi:hypothetical protein